MTQMAAREVRRARVAAMRLGEGMSPYPFWWCSLHPMPSKPSVSAYSSWSRYSVDVMALARIVERVGNIDPHRAVLRAEIVRQVRPRHQVEPGEFHGSLSGAERASPGVYVGFAVVEMERQSHGARPDGGLDIGLAQPLQAGFE